MTSPTRNAVVGDRLPSNVNSAAESRRRTRHPIQVISGADRDASGPPCAVVGDRIPIGVDRDARARRRTGHRDQEGAPDRTARGSSLRSGLRPVAHASYRAGDIKGGEVSRSDVGTIPRSPTPRLGHALREKNSGRSRSVFGLPQAVARRMTSLVQRRPEASQRVRTHSDLDVPHDPARSVVEQLGEPALRPSPRRLPDTQRARLQ